MSADDRQRWNARYRDGNHATTTPSELLTSAAYLLPASGRALDLAGGAGRHASWLARRGMRVTLADVSDVGLEIASRRAMGEGVPLEVLQVDLEESPPPAGPWDLIVLFHYLHRPLFADMPILLAPGGVLFFVQPTVKNLERHSKPSRSYLLEEGEAPRLVEGLEILCYQEGWLAEGRHEALLIARNARPTKNSVAGSP